MRPTQPTLATLRLVLRPFAESDAAVVQKLAGVREIADITLNIPHPYPDGGAEEWIASHVPAWQVASAATFAVTLRETGELIGSVGIGMEEESEPAELGYWIAVPHWGRGYATEASAAVIAFAFNELRVSRIEARHLARNPASGRVMQKLGMRRVATLRQAVRKWDKLEDVEVYAIVATDDYLRGK